MAEEQDRTQDPKVIAAIEKTRKIVHLASEITWIIGNTELQSDLVRSYAMELTVTDQDIS